jgi:hypothetical protein
MGAPRPAALGNSLPQPQLGAPVLPSFWNPTGMPNQKLQDSWSPTLTGPDTKEKDPENEFGDKNIVDWYRDQGLSVGDKDAFADIIEKLKGLRSAWNPRGPETPFSPTHYVIDFSRGNNLPYDGTTETIHNIENGMSDQEKTLWRKKWHRPDNGDTFTAHKI